MVGSDSFDSIGGADSATETESGWDLVATHDGAPALLDAILRLDTDRSYTKAELSENADVAYKQLYLGGAVEAFVDVGLLEKHDSGEAEAVFAVDQDSAIYETASSFDEAVARQLQFESERTRC